VRDGAALAPAHSPGRLSATWVDVLHARAATQPDKTAFTWLGADAARDVSLTYAELDSRARAIGALLQHTGPPGERALLLVPPGLDFIAALFGCFYAGWIAVPAYPPQLNQRLERIRSVASDARPRVALAPRATLGRIGARLAEAPDLRSLRWLAVENETARPDDWSAPGARAEDLAVLQYTSGSMAAPRGVMLSHANLLHNAAQIQQRFEIGPDSRGVIWLPPYHDMGLVGGVLEGIWADFPTALMAPVTFLQRPRRWLEAITRTAGTISGGPNFAYDLCVDRIPASEREGLDLSTWTVAFNGSEPVRETTLHRFAEAFGPCGFRETAFYPCYGLAEATLIVSGGWVESPPVVMELEDGRNVVGCGQSIDDQTVLIVDPVSCTPCPQGEVGEVWVAGPSVAAGYWRQPSLTEDVFAARLADGSGCFLRTGDVGFLGQPGPQSELFITGRLKAVLILGGRKLHAEDIEATLAQNNPAAGPGAVAALSVDVEGEERLVVIQEVRLPTNLEATAKSIRAHIAEAHQVPVWAVLLARHGSIPRTSSGKIQRAASHALFAAHQLDCVYEWQAPWR
jgi:acyl-CoA synthetase (AMP-forming)/AMP-acid ligase II